MSDKGWLWNPILLQLCRSHSSNYVIGADTEVNESESLVSLIETQGAKSLKLYMCGTDTEKGLCQHQEVLINPLLHRVEKIVKCDIREEQIVTCLFEGGKKIFLLGEMAGTHIIPDKKKILRCPKFNYSRPEPGWKRQGRLLS